MQGWAQEKEKEEAIEDILSKVTIDTIQIKATPYEKILVNGVWKDEEKPIDYYNDITIYEIRKKETGQPSAMMTGPKPAIFMLPGGAFTALSGLDIDGMNTLGTLSLGSKLADNLSAEVYVIRYITTPSTLIDNVVFPTNCNNIQNQRGKALTLEASYKAFHDLRRILRVNYLDSATIKNIDTSNFFMIGSSAGSVLALNTLFLQSSEIPDTLKFRNNCTNPNSFGVPIPISNQIRNDFWPIPSMKGIVSMAGAWINDNVGHLIDSTPATSLNTPLLLMHGTCDDIIFRREGNIGFKIFPLYNAQNQDNNGRYINGKGSEFIFNTFKDIHRKMIYTQVIRGSHAVFSTSSIHFPWDLITNNPIGNPNDPVTTEIQPFIENLINGTSNIMTFTKTISPEIQSNRCRTFDAPNDTICYFFIPTPTISYNNNICHSTNYTATLTNLPPAPFSISWSVTGNLVIVGSGTGTSVQYRSSNTSFASGSIRATITRGCSQKIFNYTVNVNANKLDTINMVSNCYTGVMGTTTVRRYVVGHNLDFSSTYKNAFFDGVSALQWELVCGSTTITSPVTNFMSGVDLVSTLSVSSPPAGCTLIRVRYLRPCGQFSNWFTGLLDECLSFPPPPPFPPLEMKGEINIYPNPSSDDIRISFKEKKEIKTDVFEVIIADEMGNIVHGESIPTLETPINVSHLRPAAYKVMLLVQDEAYFSSFIKK
jgi:hypothetical protein